MNKLSFSINNIKDKAKKSLSSKDAFVSYIRAYVLNRFKDVEPDTYYTSYPKCGRTWVRHMLRRYLEISGANPERKEVPFCLSYGNDRIIRFEHGKGDWVPAPLRKDQLIFDVEKYKDKKLIFMVRNPGDVMVSSFYHLKFRDKIYKGELEKLIRHPLVGVEKIITFMNVMVANRNKAKDSLLLYYEDFHNDSYKEFSKILGFLEIPINKDLIDQVVKETDFNTMKEKEQKGAFNEPWMKSGSRGSDNSMKVRKGKIGGYLEEMKKDDIEYVNRLIKEKMVPELFAYYG